MRATFRQISVRALPICVLTVLFLGCEEGVSPFLESDRYFSMYGVLDMVADSQFVRVVPIETELNVDPAAPIDAVVRSIDLNFGTTVTWQDSLFTFSDGSVGHVFIGLIRMQPGHTYRLEVERSDGRISTAETTMPSIPTVVIGMPQVIGGGTGSRVTQDINWMGLGRAPFRIEAAYRFLTTDASPFTDVVVDYPIVNAVGAGEVDPWTTRIQLTEDRRNVEMEIPDISAVFFLGAAMEITVLDDAFVPPGGVFDPEILSQPGVFSNVQNGFGFIGSIARFSAEWVLDETTATQLGYVTRVAQP